MARHGAEVDFAAACAKSVTAFIGPSGCGKSTLLRVLNRMFDLYPKQSAEGEVILDGENILDPHVDVNVLRSRVGMVFQKPTPFPMSIYDNIAFGVRLYEKLGKRDMDERVERALRGAAFWEEVKDKLHTSGLGLSGGQQQRLCIARSVAVQPEVILFDEPCSALDPISTAKVEELIDELVGKLHHRYRHPQHAAGGARLRLYGVHVSRRTYRIWRDRQRVHDAARKENPRLHHWPLRLTSAPLCPMRNYGPREKMMNEHTVKAYDRELEALGPPNRRNGRPCRENVADAMDALRRFDVESGAWRRLGRRAPRRVTARDRGATPS